jgi:glycosyltransferase involved in cell wall biosynthesis
LLLKLFTKGKVIYDIHEDIPAQILTKPWIPVCLRKLISTIFSGIEKLIVNNFDAIVTTTEGIANNYKSIQPIVIHNYPDLAMLPVSSTNFKDKYKNGIIYIGGISKIRGAVEMVKALEIMNPSLDARLHLIGNFDSPVLECTLQIWMI